MHLSRFLFAYVRDEIITPLLKQQEKEKDKRQKKKQKKTQTTFFLKGQTWEGIYIHKENEAFRRVMTNVVDPSTIRRFLTHRKRTRASEKYVTDLTEIHSTGLKC